MLYQGKAVGLIRLYTKEVRSFDKSELGLFRSLTEVAATAVHTHRMRERREQDERINRQVKVAAQVQRAMMPVHMPRISGLGVAASYRPSYELGGDFYDVQDVGGKLAPGGR